MHKKFEDEHRKMLENILKEKEMFEKNSKRLDCIGFKTITGVYATLWIKAEHLAIHSA